MRCLLFGEILFSDTEKSISPKSALQHLRILSKQEMHRVGCDVLVGVAFAALDRGKPGFVKARFECGSVHSQRAGVSGCGVPSH